MAEQSKKLDFDTIEIQWLRVSLELQRKALIRSRGKEMVGSEIHVLRGKEVDQVVALERKLG